MRERILSQTLAPGQAAMFYLGQLGFLIKYAGKYILVDGYLSDYVDRKNKYAPGWVRNYPAPIQAQELDFIDFVLCSHGHCDHADPDTLPVIARVNEKAKFFVPAPIRQLVTGFGIGEDRVVGLHADTEVSLSEEITVTAIPAAHEELHPDARGDYEEMGFLFRLGSLKLYHAGDCCPYAGLEARLRGCHVQILPINGRDYFRRYEQDIIGNFDCVEAITIAKNTGAGLLVPAHYDLYDANGLNPAIFVDTLHRLNPQQRFHMFAPGECYIVSE